MLDDLKYIAQRDKSDALGVAEKTPEQLLHDFAVDFERPEEIDNIVFAGMGGSALAANLFLSWTQPNVPFVINRQYEVPGFVSERTVFIASSHSGNTEETLSALALAEMAGAFVIAITSGGQLREIAENKGYPLYLVPGDYQPRMSVFFGLAALADIAEKLNLMDGVVEELRSTVGFLRSAVGAWRSDVVSESNYAKQLAEEIAGKTAVVYAGSRLSPVAYKWKISFNETSKNLAFYNQFSEFNHNEFMGWTSHPDQKPFQPIELISSFEHERILKRFEITNRLLSGKMPHPLEVHAEGDNLISQMLWTTLLGDFTSIYLALANNVDPTPVELIEKLKKELSA